jgi:DNA-directed RNA polymerase subunit RPC12/RpoP
MLKNLSDNWINCMTNETPNETTRQNCQICGGKLIPYVYGFISGSAATSSPLKDLEYAVGGCNIYPDSPGYKCVECGASSGSRGEALLDLGLAKRTTLEEIYESWNSEDQK